MTVKDQEDEACGALYDSSPIVEIYSGTTPAGQFYTTSSSLNITLDETGTYRDWVAIYFEDSPPEYNWATQQAEIRAFDAMPFTEYPEDKDRQYVAPIFTILVDGFALTNQVARTYYIKGVPKQFSAEVS